MPDPRRLIAEMRRQLDDLERALVEVPTPHLQRFVGTGVAAKHVKRSPSWVRETAVRHSDLKLGWLLPTKTWIHDLSAWEQFMRGLSSETQLCAATCEVCALPLVVEAGDRAQPHGNTEGDEKCSTASNR